MPYVHMVLIITTFGVIPVVAVLIFIYALIVQDLWGTCYGTWVLTYAVSCVCLIPYDILLVYPSFMDMKEQYYVWTEQDAEELRDLEQKARKKEITDELHDEIDFH